MLTLVFAVGALGFILLSYMLLRKTSPYTRKGGDAYVRRQKRKLLGLTMLFPAFLLVVVALVRYVAVTPENLPPPPESTEPYVPPVVSQPSESDPLAGREAPLHLATTSENATSLSSEKLPLTLAAASADKSFDNAFADPLTPPGPAHAPSPLPPFLPPSAPTQTAEEKLDAELSKYNAIIQADPKNAIAYAELGNIYASRQSWLEAQTNYEKALELDGANASIKYNLAQMQFAQKKYADARPGFAALEKDGNIGDLALYKAFLCDLYGGQAESAAKEFAAFNQAGDNASYYFANIAWSLYHQKPEEARDWLASATRIYPRDKVAIYSADLVQLGYLPLPPAP